MCELQHTANGGDGRAHGGACVSGSGSAAVGGGISEASALVFELRCRVPEGGGGHRDAGSTARHKLWHTPVVVPRGCGCRADPGPEV